MEGEGQKMPLVSVIVPVYNTERYLSACIDSIRAQTYSELEIILVDDGSTDLSLTIMRSYQDRDSRIHVITGPNAGAPHARNLGMKAAHGEYLYFFDADDLMEPEAVEILLSEYQSCPDAKLAVGFYGFVDTNSNHLPSSIKYPSAGVLDMKNSQELVTVMRLNPFPDTKMFLASEIRRLNLSWRTVKIGQDVDFYLRFLAGCKGKVCLTQKSVAQYRIVEGSIAHTPKLYILDFKDVYDQVEAYGRKINAPESFFYELCNRRISSYWLQVMKFHDFEKKAQRKQVINQFIRWAEEAEMQANGHLSEISLKTMSDFRKLKRFRMIYASALYHELRLLRLRFCQRRRVKLN